jgi:hypothetical protein
MANVPNARPLFRCCRRVSEHLLNRGATKLVSRRSHSVEFPLPRVGGSLHRGSVSSSRTCRVRFYTMTTTLPLSIPTRSANTPLIVHAELALEDLPHFRCLMNLLVSVTVALLCHSLPSIVFDWPGIIVSISDERVSRHDDRVISFSFHSSRRVLLSLCLCSIAESNNVSRISTPPSCSLNRTLTSFGNSLLQVKLSCR